MATQKDTQDSEFLQNLSHAVLEAKDDCITALYELNRGKEIIKRNIELVDTLLIGGEIPKAHLDLQGNDWFYHKAKVDLRHAYDKYKTLYSLYNQYLKEHPNEVQIYEPEDLHFSPKEG